MADEQSPPAAKEDAAAASEEAPAAAEPAGDNKEAGEGGEKGEEKSEPPAPVEEDDPAYFTNASGVKVFRRYWTPTLGDGEKPRALVHISHGACEHSGWYDKLGDALAQQGILSFAHDHVGHGKSGGERLQMENYQVYVRDSLQFIDFMKEQHADCPIFAFGYSLGAAIVISTVLKRPDVFKGVILEAPSIQVSHMNAMKALEAKIMSKVVPRRSVPVHKAEDLFADEDVVKRFNDDELTIKGPMNAENFYKMLHGLQDNYCRLSSVACPVLILQGEKDKVCPQADAMQLMSHAVSGDKTLKVFPGAVHNVLQATNGQGDELVQDSIAWINKRLS